MAKLLCSINHNPLKLLYSNPIVGTCVFKSLESNLTICKNCDVLRRGFTTHGFGKIRTQNAQANRFKQHLNLEIKALGGILSRSGFHGNEDIRFLGYSSRNFSTSRTCRSQDNKNEDEDGKKNEDKDMSMLPGLIFWTGLFFFLYTSLQLSQRDDVNQTHFVSWNEFYYNMMMKGEVSEIIIRPEAEMAIIHLHEGAIIKGQKADFETYTMKIPNPYKFEEKIRKCEEELGIKADNSIAISYQRVSTMRQFVLVAVIGLAVFLFLRNMASRIQFPNPNELFANERKAKFVRVDVLSQKGKGISFKDVAGLKEAKQEVIEFVDYLKTPDRFKELGAKIPKGALLLGPPGCGKTLLARAVATEARVPFLAMAGSEFVEMIGGLGAARVRDLFKEAKKRAPCIIYIDEIDAIGRRRGGSSMGGNNAEEEQTLNQLLVEMDGMGTQEGVIMLASTNRADVLDKALLRPGRFDRHITIDLPTMIERREIFEMYLKQLKLYNQPEALSPRLAQLTPGMSGADIANVCNEAAIHAARDCQKEIYTGDFDYALERVIAGVEKKSRLLAPSEKKIVAYHESGHALVGWLLKYTDALLRISIIPRTNSTLGFAQYMPSDQKLYNEQELFERMCMALGGRAAEVVIFNHITTGAQDDLKKVTQMAYSQVRSYGMNSVIGPISFPSESSNQLGTKPYSKKLSATIDEQAQILIGRAFRHTEELLQKNKDKLHLLATTLLKREVLNYDDIEKIIGPPPHGKKNTMEPHGWEGIMPSNDNNNRKPPQDNRT